jgi:hypothetical protein
LKEIERERGGTFWCVAAKAGTSSIDGSDVWFISRLSVCVYVCVGVVREGKKLIEEEEE